ncbi:DDE-type integrase/transposase/recombinase [Ferrovibrio sp.]|uniref:DDE-type integrase/transposase/recombinase n=1 Tax=Ferrovibrio sp. TaxID=1917215 RepID=UPI0035B2C685
MSEWFTAAELLAMRLDALPGTVQNINAKAKREAWRSCKLPRLGAPRGYHIDSLPAVVRIAIAKASVSATAAPLADTIARPATAKDPRNLAAITGRAKERAETRLLMLATFDDFRSRAGLALSTAAVEFSAAWNAGAIAADEALRADMPRVSRNSLLNWYSARAREGAVRLAGRYNGGNRKADIDATPAVRDCLLATYADKPHFSAGQLRDALREAGVPRLPSLRQIQRWMNRWRAANPRHDLQLRDPDKAKGKYLSAIGTASANIKRVNQLWEMDASPADVLCVDGRYKISAVIDVATRDALVLVTPQPRAGAHLALFRAFALSRGLPEVVKTDNGQDYKARDFITTMAALEVEQVFCPPFSPEKKPHVERFIGTLQRDLFARLPGFVGHNVADAQAIRARKTFAQRLGVSDTDAFAVELTAAELQREVLHWLESYRMRRHDSLGRSPQAEAEALAAGAGAAIKPLPHARDMDICLLPLKAEHTVGKEGIRAEGTRFIADWNGALAGTRVLVRLDPADMGLVYCFDPVTHDFIGEAYAPERAGLDRRAMAVESKRRQREVDGHVHSALKRMRRELKPHKVAAAIAAGTPLLPDSITIPLTGPAGSSSATPAASHMRAVAIPGAADVPALPAPEQTAVMDPAVRPMKEAEYVAWVLAGYGDDQDARDLLRQARQPSFRSVFEIGDDQIAALRVRAGQVSEADTRAA